MASSSEQSSSSKDSLVDSLESLTNVSETTYTSIKKMTESTFDPDMVGKGHDAKNLDQCKISVTDIKRVKNETLLNKYNDFSNTLRGKLRKTQRRRAKIIAKLPNIRFEGKRRKVVLNETYLFHGTSASAADSIIRKGFILGNPERNLYGGGVYFAEEFTKADQYADKRKRVPHGTELTVLLCKVLLGNAHVCSKYDADECKIPPYMPCDTNNRYDSVLGSGPNMAFREFVVYDKNQCFPEFLIKYNRIPCKKPGPTKESTKKKGR